MGSPCCRRSASEVSAMLGLHPHPDGGFYKETLRDSSLVLSSSQLPPCYKVDRPISTAIYFLLPSGSVAHLHRIPCAETFHFYMGEPVTVFELRDGGAVKLNVLGPDLGTGQLFQYTVPPALHTHGLVLSQQEMLNRAPQMAAHLNLLRRETPSNTIPLLA